jgi:Nif-specific regulatory protein
MPAPDAAPAGSTAQSGGGHPAALTEAESAAPLSERDRFIAAMERSGWVQAKAARILGLTPRQVGYALKKYGIEIKRF